MKVIIISILLFSVATANGQLGVKNSSITPDLANINHMFENQEAASGPGLKKIQINKQPTWRFNKNKIITGGLLVLSGMAKGFNETLQFNWQGFAAVFPKANPQWFYPQQSFANKYKDGDPSKGARFPLSTSVLVMFTDQFHLNNFVQKTSMVAALVIKIGEGKKPFRQYLFDAAYYTACYQIGFAGTYYYFKSRMTK